MKRIVEWGVALLRHWFDRPYKTCVVTGGLPSKLKPRTIYIVEEDGFEEQAAMLCPCGCKRVLHMNLIPDEHPCWTARRHSDGTVTLHPSVWRTKDCGTHFWFRGGRVTWCP